MRDPKSLAKRPTKKSDWLGQVITPTAIANRMAITLLSNRPKLAITILDACVGPFTFPRAIIHQHLMYPEDQIIAIDIDSEMLSQRKKWSELGGYNIKCIEGDYLEFEAKQKYDYAIINPPYIRQEWIDKKEHYQDVFQQEYAVDIPGTSNLYIYFVVKVIQDLKPRGKFAIIIYDSWQSTLYGRWLMAYLRQNCESLEVDTVSNQPFAGRLIDATILYGTKSGTSSSKDVMQPIPLATKNHSPMSEVGGFVNLETLFSTRRGLRLKQVNFFLGNLQEYKGLGATPFIKKVAKLNGLFSVPDNHPEAALLIHSKGENRQLLKILLERLHKAQKEPEKNISVLTWYQDQPSEWYIHRNAPYAPILFNYYLRKRPRHIYNPNRAYSDNFYGLIPLNGDPLAWFAVLNSTCVCAEIMAHSRNQGSGLAKIQLYEYRKILVPAIQNCRSSTQNQFQELGKRLVEIPDFATETIAEIDKLIANTFTHPLLNQANIIDTYNQLDNKARKPRIH